MLKLQDVISGYGKLQIINGVSIEARPREITVIVGPNGSGKSTLLKTVSGLTTISHGSVSLDGKEISGLSPHEIARSGIAYLPQTEGVFTQLTVAENFKMAGYIVAREDFEARLTEALAMFPQLSAYQKTKTISLSGGERQMVAMTMALIRKPSVMMFDEPTANLAPKVAAQVLQTISMLAKNSGITAILVEQNARKALEIGDRAYLLVNGTVTFAGDSRELLGHKELARMYLGLKVTE